jgi:hypothetical protein
MHPVLHLVFTHPTLDPTTTSGNNNGLIVYPTSTAISINFFCSKPQVAECVLPQIAECRPHALLAEWRQQCDNA